MNAVSGFHLFLAAEDRLHREVVMYLANTLICQEADWFSPNDLRPCWRGRTPEEEWFALKNAYREARVKGLKVHGHIGGSPAQPEATMFRAALLIAHPHQPDAVVFVRDADHHLNRRRGFDQVMADPSFHPSYPVILALPEPEIEAWIIAGFKPSGPDEVAALREIQDRLGFGPDRNPERLTSHPNDAQTDAKRIRRQLTGENPERDMVCLADLELLRERGAACGLAAYLDEVEEKLVPLFAGCSHDDRTAPAS